MGNGLSNKPQETKQTSQPDFSSGGKVLDDTKKILLLHKSSSDQKEVVENFRHALTMAASGAARITELLNIADKKELGKDLQWLEEVNNIVLIILTTESIKELAQIISAKGFANANGNLHQKIFSVAFGKSLAEQWPPGDIKKGTSKARDFAFGFSSVANLKAKDFEESQMMSRLVAAIKGTD